MDTGWEEAGQFQCFALGTGISGTLVTYRIMEDLHPAMQLRRRLLIHRFDLSFIRLVTMVRIDIDNVNLSVFAPVSNAGYHLVQWDWCREEDLNLADIESVASVLLGPRSLVVMKKPAITITVRGCCRSEIATGRPVPD